MRPHAAPRSRRSARSATAVPASPRSRSPLHMHRATPCSNRPASRRIDAWLRKLDFGGEVDVARRRRRLPRRRHQVRELGVVRLLVRSHPANHRRGIVVPQFAARKCAGPGNRVPATLLRSASADTRGRCPEASRPRRHRRARGQPGRRNEQRAAADRTTTQEPCPAQPTGHSVRSPFGHANAMPSL